MHTTERIRYPINDILKRGKEFVTSVLVTLPGKVLFCFRQYRRYLSLTGSAISIIFAATKHVFRRDKSMFVATKLLSGQNYVSRDKTFVANFFCRDLHSFVATKDVCHKHVFVATKIILVAAPANHRHRADKCHDESPGVISKYYTERK